MIKIEIEITLSVNRLNADRDCDDQFDPQDYAHKLEDYLKPKLDQVVVKTTAFSADHDIEIVLPEKAASHMDMTDLLARKIIEAVRGFHTRAPGIVDRLAPRQFFRAG
jgi:hypothetical protein